jgi:predicted nucleic acid-binding Zn ribbon protein
MITYNYYCLSSREGKCKKHAKLQQHQAKDEEALMVCDECGNNLKVVGIATSIVHKGTQESKI